MTFDTPSYLDSARMASELLAARGLQMQRRGKPDVFVANLETSLALVRNLGDLGWAMGIGIEQGQMTALMRWLGNLGDDGPLLRRVLAALRKHRALVPSKPPDPRFAAYLIARNSLARPGEFVGGRLPGDRPLDVEPALVEAAAELPWEKARMERQLRYHFWVASLEGHPSESPWRPDVPWRFGGYLKRQADWPRRWARLDGMIQVTALRLYQAEKGKPAATLDALVPDYLPSLPRDPFGPKAFGYRLSEGEEIELPIEPEAGGGPPGQEAPAADQVLPALPAPKRSIRVRPGQAVLWCVGEDGHDDGGTRQGPEEGPSSTGEDVIFVVPLPRK
jgi:hypothetical protein